MAPLKSLTIENFQAHTKLEVKLDPHVTTIIGPSDVGKSALIRAIRWLAQNKPAGDVFIRHGSKRARVTIATEDQIIIRERGGGDNSYTVNEKPLKAFGNDVPPEVQKILNLSEINFQRQHDSPFWFTQTAGEVSRQLNSIVNLEIIDTTLANLDKVIRDTRAELSAWTTQLETAKNSRSALSWAKKADTDLSEAEKVCEIAQNYGAEVGRLNDLISGVEKYGERADTLRNASSNAEQVVSLGDIWEGAEKQRKRVQELVDRVIQLRPKARLEIPDLQPLIQLEKRAREVEEEKSSLETTINRIQKAEENVNRFEIEYKRSEEKFKTEMGDVCRLCGNRLQ